MTQYKEWGFLATGKYVIIKGKPYKQFKFDKIVRVTGEELHFMAQSYLLKPVEEIKGLSKTLRHIKNRCEHGLSHPTRDSQPNSHSVLGAL